ncbi:hypothetical protein AQUCO_06000016v1 [Aquilegia coerulea]|uniref:Uncharacterized protein n=1 Tax=Aquilegia coerulea TaxID=218851 RepID=A0A2G5CEU0_AQUCA|nr:hypothetical protein AQUCO_06000016v1 [Aquilegia coerulea]
MLFPVIHCESVTISSIVLTGKVCLGSPLFDSQLLTLRSCCMSALRCECCRSWFWYFGYVTNCPFLI